MPASQPFILPNPFSFRLPTTPVYSVAMTGLLSCVLLMAFFTIQMMGVAIFALSILPASQSHDWVDIMAYGSKNGTVMALIVSLTLVGVLIITAMLIKLKKGSQIRDYLALYAFKWGHLWRGIGLLILLNVVIQAVTVWLDIEPMDFLDEMYFSAHPLWLLVLGMVVFAPIYEEVMFRGFMWVGIANSRFGFWGASIVTSLVFALIHTQYTPIELVAIVFLALLFSYTRAKSGSLFVPIILHILNNGLAMGLYVLGRQV